MLPQSDIMSSPISSKRKRTNSQHLSTADIAKSSTTDLQQPSSRDASGEEGDDSTGPAIPPVVKATTSNHPSKRARKASVSEARNVSSNGDAGKDTSISKEDPGEPSETTPASSDIEGHIKDRPDLHVDTVREQELMKPPVLGQVQDPAGGYKTNPPPEDRSVRVYADGVFDLFHVG